MGPHLVSTPSPAARAHATANDWRAANYAHLDACVDRLRLLVQRRVLWLRELWRHDPLTAHRGLVVSDERADLILTGQDELAEHRFYMSNPAALRLESMLTEAAAVVESRRQKTLEAGAPPRLEALARRFGLEPFERDVVLLAFAPEHDADLAVLYAYVQDDATRQHATPELALALLGGVARTRTRHRAALAPGATLRRYGLVELLDEGDGWTRRAGRPLRVPERVQDFLLAPASEPAPSPFLLAVPHAPLSEAGEALARRLADGLVDGRHRASELALSLVGPRGSGRRALAAAVASHLGLRLHALDLAACAADVRSLARAGRALEREARLADVAVYVEGDGLDAITDPEARRHLVSVLDRLDLPFVVGGTRRWPGRRATAIQTVPALGSEERRALWRAAFAAEGWSTNGGVERLVHQFELGPSAIADTVRTATRMAALEPRPGDADPVELAWKACRERSGPSLDLLAQRIESARGWEDIVLPDETLGQLMELGAQLRLRSRVYDAWGFGEKLGRRRGISALFSGPSGTGKTMAAEILATEASLPLYRVDLSGVVSKYIGETEKNLKQVFDAAEDSGVVLFFDEADALFGKRSEVRDSHDRYANMEVNYLLQRMEDYVGLVVLATNMKSHLDPAFLRRLRFLIDFPFPDPAQRRRIWEKSFPAQAELGALDLDALALLSVPGGNIRNIAVNGAFLAAAEDQPIEMRHLYHAARQEYAKIERLVVSAEFGRHVRVEED